MHESTSQNQPSQFCRQPENGLRIIDFKIDGNDDRELLKLLPFLRLISNFGDVRPVSSHWEKYT